VNISKTPGRAGLGVSVPFVGAIVVEGPMLGPEEEPGRRERKDCSKGLCSVRRNLSEDMRKSEGVSISLSWGEPFTR